MAGEIVLAQAYALDKRPNAAEIQGAIQRRDLQAIAADLPEYHRWLRGQFLEATNLAYNAGQRQALTQHYQQISGQIEAISGQIRQELAANTTAIALSTSAVTGNTTALSTATTATTDLARELSALRLELRERAIAPQPIQQPQPPAQPVVIKINNSNSGGDWSGGWEWMGLAFFVLLLGSLLLPLGRSVAPVYVPTPVYQPQPR